MNQQSIALSTTDGFEFVNIDEIIRIQAEGSYSSFYLLSGRKILIAKNISHIEESLSNSKNILRVHKSTIINIRYIKKFSKSEGGYVIMSDNTKINFPTKRRQELLERITVI